MTSSCWHTIKMKSNDRQMNIFMYIYMKVFAYKKCFTQFCEWNNYRYMYLLILKLRKAQIMRTWLDLCIVDSPALRTLHSKFKQIVSENRIKCLSFGETEKQSVGYKRIKVLIVPPESSGKWDLTDCCWMLKSSSTKLLVSDYIAISMKVKIRNISNE